MSEPLVLLESYAAAPAPDSFVFSGLCGEVVAWRPEQVRLALATVEEAVAQGVHAAGFLAYEAAPGLDPALLAGQATGMPLVWFGLFHQRERVRAGGLQPLGGYSISTWKPSITRPAYDRALQAIREYIAAGDTYQVNFTMRLRADFAGDDRALYRDLCQVQRASYCAYLDLGRYRILSASPELFFALKDGALKSRPMKGTRPRGRWLAEDEAMAKSLQHSPKERAENVMIVDLLRNDLGRVSQPGSVQVPRLWEVERYETVLQLTSTVQSRLRAGVGLVDVFAALFPCGSVTGVPKVRTMQVIEELEEAPRGIYTGCIGFVSPGLEACFNVAIRTVYIDQESGRAEFGVGGGITWDSHQEGEYEECLVKARVLNFRHPEFSLVETMLFEAGKGYYFLERHLERLRNSAQYFGFCCDPNAVSQLLAREVAGLEQGAFEVQLTLSQSGETQVSCSPLPGTQQISGFRVAVATEKVNQHDPFLFHQTTHRQVYEQRRVCYPDCDDVILCNQQGQVTECSSGNLVAVLEGEKWTPPLECGLLPGTFRAELLSCGQIRERILKTEDLAAAEALYLIDSVRRWVELELIRDP